MDAAWVRDQLRALLQEDVYALGEAGDQDFLEDFELLVREYQLGKERDALVVIRGRARTALDPGRSLPGGTFPWLDGVRRTDADLRE